MAYRRLPLFAKILVGAVFGCAYGALAGGRASELKPIADLVLQFLTLLASPLIFLSLVHSLLTAEVRGRFASRLVWLLTSNTLVASLIGLVIVGWISPGTRQTPTSSRITEAIPVTPDPFPALLSWFPKDFLSPFVGNNVVGIILVGLVVTLALRKLRDSRESGTEHAERIRNILGYVKLGLDLTLVILGWVFELIPIGVAATVAGLVGTRGVAAVNAMGWFIATALIALTALCVFYGIRLRISAKIGPLAFIRGGADALAMAFSTASSMATLPVSFTCATQKLGLHEESASLGVMVGGTLNHDGGAQYQVVAAVFIAQLTNHPLAPAEIGVLLLMALFASVCTAGIPQGGLVTMVAVFRAVHLPQAFIPLFLPVDWLLDRCRTTVNVAGDLVATCILDRSRSSVPRIMPS